MQLNARLAFDTQILVSDKKNEKVLFDLEINGKKKKKKSTLLEFNRILDKISHDDKIGHLFVVDIKFYHKNDKTQFFNEILPLPHYLKKTKR